MTQRRKHLSAVAASAAVVLGLAACGGGSTDDPTTTSPGADDNGTAAASDPTEVTIALPPGGWPEGDAASYLWANFLESEGYDVTLEQGGDMGVIYTAVAGGEYDLFFDSWLPITHGPYFEEYDELERVSVWYDDARLTIAVNEDSPAQTIGDLAEHADAYGSRIVGIEPGAGLTRVTREEAIPTYGLDMFEHVESSTPAMLAELSSATDAGRDIVVTLWRPHWAYDAFPIRDLEDPEGAMGEAETIEVAARPGFTEEYPQLSAWLEAWEMTGDELASITNLMFNENDGEDLEGSVEQWLEENPNHFDAVREATID